MLKFYRNVVLSWLMKLVGMRFTTVEIEPGTVMTFWVPATDAGRKPAVVFLHGFAGDGILTWQFQVMALAKKYAIYVPDIIFFGGSTTARPERTVRFQAECVARGLSRLGVRRCTLVGFSYGGMVAFNLARFYPELVHSMVISCSVLAMTASISRALLQKLGFSAWSEYLLPESVDGVKTLFVIGTDMFRNLPRFVYKNILKTQFDNRKERTELLEALVEPDATSPTPPFQQRICLLWGKGDQIFDMEMARLLKEQIGERATLDYVEGAGHFVSLERPCSYNRKLKNTLASLLEDNEQQTQ